MSQDETRENYDLNENAPGSTQENLNPAETLNDAGQTGSQEIDNLPIESIGSYARLEELLSDEEKEKTANPTVQS